MHSKCWTQALAQRNLAARTEPPGKAGYPHQPIPLASNSITPESKTPLDPGEGGKSSWEKAEVSHLNSEIQRGGGKSSSIGVVGDQREQGSKTKLSKPDEGGQSSWGTKGEVHLGAGREKPSIGGGGSIFAASA